MEHEQEDSIDYRIDAGPAPKDIEDKPKMATITVSFDTVKKVFQKIKELFR